MAGMKDWIFNTKNGWRGEIVARRTCAKKKHRNGTERCNRAHEQFQIKYVDMPPMIMYMCGGDTFWEPAKDLVSG